MDNPTLALLLTLVVHLVGIVALLWLAFDGRMDLRAWWPREDDGGGGGPGAPAPDDPPGGGIPLPGAEPAAVRLRTEHDRAPTPRRVRRPAHAPEPGRTREPA